MKDSFSLSFPLLASLIYHCLLPIILQCLYACCITINTLYRQAVDDFIQNDNQTVAHSGLKLIGAAWRYAYEL